MTLCLRIHFKNVYRLTLNDRINLISFTFFFKSNIWFKIFGLILHLTAPKPLLIKLIHNAPKPILLCSPNSSYRVLGMI